MHVDRNGRESGLCQSSETETLLEAVSDICKIALNGSCRPARACLRVNSSYLGCQGRLTKELLGASPRGSCQRVTLPSTTPDNPD